MWLVIEDGTVIPVPTVSRIDKDSCGNEVGANSPDPDFRLPPGAHPVAFIHTHPSAWAADWPRTGDYDLAQKYSVYGIHGTGTWVLRHGAAYDSTPERLSGSAPTRIQTKKSAKDATCTMKK